MVHVHEDGPLSAHLVLPPSTSLSDAELETVTAGHVSSEKAIYDSGYDHQHRQPDGSWGPHCLPVSNGEGALVAPFLSPATETEQ